MAHTIKDVQTELVKAGFYIGDYGPNKDGVDGMWGTLCIRAMGTWQGQQGLPKNGAWNDAASLDRLFRADPAPVPPMPSATPARRPRKVPLDWMPKCSIERIVVHWTAGAHTASRNDQEHYHVLINSDGTIVRGVPTIDKNARPMKSGYAAHTLNCNTASIGVSLACMGGAIEQPFDTGFAPMTREQWDQLPFVLADLCERYSIKPERDKVLSHAEVESTLNIKQRGKWDISRLSFDLNVKGAHVIGDMFRKATYSLL